MKRIIMKCVDCGQYTLGEVCSRCGGETKSAHPAKYSPDDEYAIYKARPLESESD